ncbi:MAG: hypothetical protein C5B54_01205 [Acidobacteria bacterium]|nr:MAG: hypothetical protein C5B54_01205 [Acidobacteriota bacterium]
MTEQKQARGIGMYLVVYFWLLILALNQIIFAYQMGPQLSLMLLTALIQATLAVLFFMNLIGERRIVTLALIPAALFVLFMMNMFWSDSFRLLVMRPFTK